MMQFVLKYQHTIDDITTNKTLKLRRYGLNNDDWAIPKDLDSILKVM